MILNIRHKNIFFIQCEQYAQTTYLVKKMNADYYVLLGVFTLSDCQYFIEKFLSSFKPKILFELIKYMNENNHRFL